MEVRQIVLVSFVVLTLVATSIAISPRLSTASGGGNIPLHAKRKLGKQKPLKASMKSRAAKHDLMKNKKDQKAPPFQSWGQLS